MENQIEVPYHMTVHGYRSVNGEGCSSFFPGVDVSSVSAAGVDPTLPWCLPSIRSISNLDQDPEFFSSHLPPFASPIYGDMNSTRILAGLQSGGGDVGLNRFLQAQGSAASSLFGTIHAELGKLSAQEIMDAKALAASKSHSEAERRRRERINGHLAKLRSILPNTAKTDKASLLAEVIHHVKELKRQTSDIAEESPLPSEADELTVDSTCEEDGKFVVRASLCCDDRPDLLRDLISAVKALRVPILRAEITTVGGRVKIVLVIAGSGYEEDDDRRHDLMAAIQDGLKAVVEQTAKHGPSAAGGSKRQRTTSLASIIEQSSI